MCFKFINVAIIRIDLQSPVYIVSEGVGSLEVCAQITSGTIQVNETVSAVIQTISGTASSEGIAK